MSHVKLEDLTEDQRKSLISELAKVEKTKRSELAKKRKAYEKNREARIQKIVKGVIKIEQSMIQFKNEVSELMALQHSELDEFGMVPTKSKGGFSIISNDGNFKITRSRDTDPKWDETAIKGTNLIKEFLVQQGQKQVDPAIYELLMSLLEKNNQGELEFSKVMLFIQHEDKFTDPLWLEGLRLLKEGYHVEFKKFGYQFFKKNEEGKFKAISINFSNL